MMELSLKPTNLTRLNGDRTRFFKKLDNKINQSRIQVSLIAKSSSNKGVKSLSKRPERINSA
jgi:hypothetical protein